MAMKVHIITYGCTFNQADTDAMKAALAARGDFEFSNTEGDAEVVVMNTCSVKDGTQNKILHKAKELEAAGRKLVMTGCLAQATPEIVSKEVPGKHTGDAGKLGNSRSHKRSRSRLADSSDEKNASASVQRHGRRGDCAGAAFPRLPG